MEDVASLGGGSTSTDVVSNVSSVIPVESDASPRDGSDVEMHEQQAEGSEHDLPGLDEQEEAGSSLSEELSVVATAQEQRGETLNDGSGASPQDQRFASPQDQRFASPQDQRGASLQEQRFGSPQDQRFASPQEQRFASPRDQRFASPQEQRFAPPRDQRFASPQDQRGASLQDQRGASLQDQRGASLHEQRFASPQDQRGALLRDQRGALLRDQRGGSPQEQTFASSQDQRLASSQDQRLESPQNQIGASPQDQIGASQQDQRETSPQDQRGTSPQDQKEASPQDQIGSLPHDQRFASPQDQILASPQDQRGTSPQDQRGTSPQDQREASPQDQKEASPHDQREASPQDQRGASPQDQLADSGDKSLDVNTEDRPPTQKSLTNADSEKQSEQGEMIYDLVSAKHSPVERLITSRQSQFKDAFSEDTGTKDVDEGSADGASFSTMDSQSYTNTGSLSGCCCQQPREQAKVETDTDNSHIGATATPTVLGTDESRASLERVNDSRVPNQTEPNLEEVGDSLSNSQYKYEKLEAKENEVSGQSCQQEIVEEVFRTRSAEEENHLKAEITSLQTRLNTLIKDNNEKGMRIIALESNLLEMTAKLLSAEKKCAPLEVSPSRRETNKSRTCAIL